MSLANMTDFPGMFYVAKCEYGGTSRNSSIEYAKATTKSALKSRLTALKHHWAYFRVLEVIIYLPKDHVTEQFDI